MKNFLTKTILSALLTISLTFAVALPALAQTTTSGTYNFKDQSGLGMTANVAGFETGVEATSLEGVISRVIYALLGLLGVIFFVLVVYGAYTWMTARGNEEKVKKANGIVMDALLGLIITLAAYALSYFLISYFW